MISNKAFIELQTPFIINKDSVKSATCAVHGLNLTAFTMTY